MGWEDLGKLSLKRRPSVNKREVKLKEGKDLQPMRQRASSMTERSAQDPWELRDTMNSGTWTMKRPQDKQKSDKTVRINSLNTANNHIVTKLDSPSVDWYGDYKGPQERVSTNPQDWYSYSGRSSLTIAPWLTTTANPRRWTRLAGKQSTCPDISLTSLPWCTYVVFLCVMCPTDASLSSNVWQLKVNKKAVLQQQIYIHPPDCVVGGSIIQACCKLLMPVGVANCSCRPYKPWARVIL